MQLKTTIGSFFAEFSKFEIHAVGMALRALSKDAVFVEQAEKLLDLEARLKLLERMAFVRAVSPHLIAELDALLVRARKLGAERDDVARGSAMSVAEHVKLVSPAPAAPKSLKARGADYARLAQMSDLVTPTVAQIQAYTDEALELQHQLRVIAEKIDQQILAADEPAQAAG